MSIGTISAPALRRRAWFGRVPWFSFLLLLPAVALMAIFFLVPIINAGYLSLTNQELAGPNAVHWSFIGLKNFDRMRSDPFLSNAIWKTLIYVGASAIVGSSVIGMVLALLKERAAPWLGTLVSSIVIIAWVIPEIGAAVIWTSFAQPGGSIDALLPGNSGTNWLAVAPMTILCLANVWRGAAFSMLIFSAGLRNISSEVKEAAVLDGASGWQVLVLVILPLLKSTIVTNFILVTIGNLSDFTLIFALTHGGPGNATQTLALYTYEQAFVFYELGYGTAVAVLLVVIGAIASFIYVRLLRAEI
jgi:multiple sugar transport system permease protein